MNEESLINLDDSRLNKRIEAEIRIRFAGGITEAVLRGKSNRIGAERDYEVADELIAILARHKGGAIKNHHRRLYKQTKELVLMPSNWREIELLATELLIRKEITTKEVRELIQGQKIEDLRAKRGGKRPRSGRKG